MTEKSKQEKEEERRKLGLKIMAEKCLNLKKDMDIQVQDAQRILKNISIIDIDQNILYLK